VVGRVQFRVRAQPKDDAFGWSVSLLTCLALWNHKECAFHSVTSRHLENSHGKPFLLSAFETANPIHLMAKKVTIVDQVKSI
jgi:hypothetical protein